MRAQPNRLEDKRLLNTLSKYLKISPSRMRLDVYGDWNVVGKKGKIFTDGQLWYLYVSPENSRVWNNIKKKLAFMDLSQDGEDEGILKLERMPSESEAKVVRKVLGMRISTILTEERRAKLLETSYSPDTEGVSGSNIDLN